jgi:hypothetical protein
VIDAEEMLWLQEMAQASSEIAFFGRDQIRVVLA